MYANQQFEIGSMQPLTREQATKSSRSVRSARKKTGHAFEEIHPIASESSLIKYERTGRNARMLLALTKMKDLTCQSAELQKQ